MRIDELDYELPPELIARTPADRRDAARLLVYERGGGAMSHRVVADLPALMRPGDLLVINDTKVLPARFDAVRVRTGGKVEGLFVETRDDQMWHVLLKSGGKLGPGERLDLAGAGELELITQREDGSWNAARHSELDTAALLDRVGRMPLPPYIRAQREGDETRFDALDRQRYQTVYARQHGAVAAPTAGLHFTEALLADLRAMGVRIAPVTLHVGLGTFAPVRTDTLEAHDMHEERFTVPAATLAELAAARADRRRIVAVGTTTVRTLESLPPPPELDPTQDYSAATRLLISPGFAFRYTDALMTNFHLPRSTLLALVAALTGLDRLKALYAEAIARRYRFYSYGDAMLIV
ncbi:MAG: tRNA preQ1(34) S-adenosylmethionine ribosyltransferase-isomerase QueA [Planctomycetes bacterium]|nr:tRNA preQ1(34) S-adenosylmethionine ribosyltransferase-isomerase QueA [Planctomycetota bacterium]